MSHLHHIAGGASAAQYEAYLERLRDARREEKEEQLRLQKKLRTFDSMIEEEEQPEGGSPDDSDTESPSQEEVPQEEPAPQVEAEAEPEPTGGLGKRYA